MTASPRDIFRESVFDRDDHKCVICGSPAKDAHHIIERRLWPDGGYFLTNGASLCEEHHIAAEQTTLSCDEIRRAAKIEKIYLPGHLYANDQPYDKWGNPILPNGQRMRGELFDDPSVQKILKQGNVLDLFTSHVKYPRTYHLPWSPGLLNDDRMMDSLDGFEGQEVVVTVKMDGENTTMYRDYLHNRSLDYEPHPSRDRVRALHGTIAHDIPDGWRLSVENLYAKHAIHYQNLDDWALLFGVWDERNVLRSWDDTRDWADLLGITLCPILYRGPWDERHVRSIYKATYNGDECEGYVVRVAGEIHAKEFRSKVGKYVRAGHVPVHGGHWKNRIVVPNGLRAR